ncbi:hypothetical protein SAMN05444266_108145 [Chitinophaga jiangningensis]|uniref:Uncharacterized protein n=1 Tax=Chitinophaga jiangningensis TaxID=1419482 RepID=A0A1M7IXZ3_9BACT|nr:hypothetical protein [Chitinophaga jiangningensis]SHM45704.1 hypothetical protein SAMN05444266_108145 [Chitinophaga jiangningensis]
MKIVTTLLIVLASGALSAQTSRITNIVVAIGKAEVRGQPDSKMQLTVGYENTNTEQLTPIAKCPLVERWNSNKMRDNEFLLECDDQGCIDSLKSNSGYMEIILTPSLRSDLTLQYELRFSYIDGDAGEKTITRTREIKIPRGSPTFKVNWDFNEKGTVATQ